MATGVGAMRASVNREIVRRALTVARWLGRIYGALGQLYFGAGTVMAIVQLAGFLGSPSWSGLPDALTDAAFGFFLWPMVLMARASN